MKKIKRICIVLIILLTMLFSITYYNNTKEINTIKSYKQLESFYKFSSYRSLSFGEKILTLPFSVLTELDSYLYGDVKYSNENTGIFNTDGIQNESLKTNDYSKTNTQVEGVDEADIIKTDGKYTYSISNNKVVITNVTNPSSIKVESKTMMNGFPNDLILYQDKLVVISTDSSYESQSTIVSIYDIKNKTNPVKLKSFTLMEPYTTSRCIDNKLFIMSSGYLKKEDNRVDTSYIEDNNKKELPLSKFKYLKDVKTNNQTLIAEVDLNNLSDNIKLDSYLVDLSNAYVDANNIYLTNATYSYNNNNYDIKKIFGLKGIFGISDIVSDYSYSGFTQIFKFDMTDDGVKYNSKGRVEGRVINQYSFDEKNDHLRVGVETNSGSKVVILDEKLNEISSTSYLAKGERMYATRFMGDKAYLVTYRNTDPLFVVDLKDETNPKVLGELHIPGYSSYLHPYDENHLIGIGMETEETVNRDASGKVISTSAIVTGMKMSLFDVSDVTNPKEISKTVIGDRYTLSSVLTNPKALLFSKEKELLAIPVNNYDEELEVDETDKVSDEINDFNRRNKNRKSEGYFVYNINLEDGFKLKGSITHEINKNDVDEYYWRYDSKLLRGLYIGDNLITVSEDEIKINDLNNLDLLSELKLK